MPGDVANVFNVETDSANEKCACRTFGQLQINEIVAFVKSRLERATARASAWNSFTESVSKPKRCKVPYISPSPTPPPSLNAAAPPFSSCGGSITGPLKERRGHVIPPLLLEKEAAIRRGRGGAYIYIRWVGG